MYNFLHCRNCWYLLQLFLDNYTFLDHRLINIDWNFFYYCLSLMNKIRNLYFNLLNLCLENWNLFCYVDNLWRRVYYFLHSYNFGILLWNLNNTLLNLNYWDYFLLNLRNYFYPSFHKWYHLWSFLISYYLNNFLMNFNYRYCFLSFNNSFNNFFMENRYLNDSLLYLCYISHDFFL
jgi:hypothetical protein